MSDNGGKIEARLSTVERSHEAFRRDLRDLLTAQVIQKDQIDDLLQTQNKMLDRMEQEREQRREDVAALDARLDKLISAIGEYLRREK